MAKTDWGLNDIVRPQDMNDIGEELNQLRTDVDNIEVPPASLTQAGIVQLSNATDGVSESKAATEKALGLVMAEAQAGKQAGIERKNEVVAALNSIGVAASTSESWDSLIAKMAAIIKATGNAGVGDVLSGRTFSNETGNNRIGTMANQGAQIITPGTINKAIPAGYHNGSGHVVGDPDLVAANFPKDVNLFGIQGILERMTTAEKQAIANAISGKGVPASVNDSNTVLANKIGQIVTGKRFVIGTVTTPSGSSGTVTGIPFAIRNIIMYKAPADGVFGVYSLDAPSLVSVNTLNVGGLIGGPSSQTTFEIISGGFTFNFRLTLGYSASWGYIVTE